MSSEWFVEFACGAAEGMADGNNIEGLREKDSMLVDLEL